MEGFGSPCFWDIPMLSFRLDYPCRLSSFGSGRQEDCTKHRHATSYGSPSEMLVGRIVWQCIATTNKARKRFAGCKLYQLYQLYLLKWLIKLYIYNYTILYGTRIWCDMGTFQRLPRLRNALEKSTPFSRYCTLHGPPESILNTPKPCEVISLDIILSKNGVSMEYPCSNPTGPIVHNHMSP